MAGTLTYAPLNANPALHFPSNGEDVVVDVQVGYDTAATAFLQTTDEAITMTITAPDGTVYASAAALASPSTPRTAPGPGRGSLRGRRSGRRPRRPHYDAPCPSTSGLTTAQHPTLQQASP